MCSQYYVYILSFFSFIVCYFHYDLLMKGILVWEYLVDYLIKSTSI